MADFQPVNIADIYAKADAARANEQNMQINAYSLKKAQDADATDTANKAIFSSSVNPDGSFNSKAASQALMKGGQYKQGMELQNDAMTQQKNQMAMNDSVNTHFLQGLAGVSASSDPIAAAHALIDDTKAKGLWDDTEAQKMHDKIPKDPAQLKDLTRQLANSLLSPKELVQQDALLNAFAPKPTQPTPIGQPAPIGQPTTDATGNPIASPAANPSMPATNGFDLSTPQKRKQAFFDANRIIDPQEKASVLATLNGTQQAPMQGSTQAPSAPQQSVNAMPYTREQIGGMMAAGLTDQAKFMQSANDKVSEGFNKAFLPNGQPNAPYQNHEFALATARAHLVQSRAGDSPDEPMSPDQLASNGAAFATGMPLSQIVPGYGKQAVAKREEVKNEGMKQIMAETGMDAKQAGGEWAQRQIDYVAGKSSSRQLTVMQGATKQAVSQLDFNIKKTNEEMAKIPSSELSPLINAIARGTEKWTGNPQYSSLYYYLGGAAIEAARIRSGGQASVAQLHAGAQEEAKQWANINMTPASWKAVAAAMQQEGHAKLKTYVDALNSQRIGGGNTALPQGQSSATPIKKSTVSNW